MPCLQAKSRAQPAPTWLPHMRRETILQSAMDLSVRLAQPRLRQISNRQRMRRLALSRMYCMSLPSASPSSFSRDMNDCNHERSYRTVCFKLWPAD